MRARINPATHSPGGNPHPQYILDYLEMYRRANPNNALPRIWARGNGWVELEQTSKRPSQIVAMTAELDNRVRRDALKDPRP